MKVTNESELATATPTLERATESTQRWNTKNLGWRLAADATGAACAGVLVAPVISIIDRYDFSGNFHLPPHIML